MYLSIDSKIIYFRDAISFFDRLVGFMFHFKKITTGLRFPNCRSIHTFLMFQKIDVIITDKENHIIALFPNFNTERVVLPKKRGYYVYELPLNSIQNLLIGDTLNICKKEM